MTAPSATPSSTPGPEAPPARTALPLLPDDQLGRDLAAVDWAATPLGPPETWSQSLAAVVRVLLSSRFSMWMAWGPELTFFCNDAYRRDTLASKYPWALGRPASEVWAEIWPDIGPRIDRVLTEGVATWDERLLLLLERSGFTEESYHTFSYSPLTDDDGRIAGMLCVVSEDTEAVVSTRRIAVARDVGVAVTALRSDDEVLEATTRALEPWGEELPFTCTYLLEPGEEGSPERAVLAATTGTARGSRAAAPVLDADDAAPVWPLEALRAGGRTLLVEDVAQRAPDLPLGPHGVLTRAALVVPFRSQEGTPLGMLVAGLNPLRPVDDGATGLVELVAGQVGAALSSARAHQAERDRAARLEELDRAKTAFFTNVSHEFRTPLTLMLGPAEDALADTADPLPPRQRDRVEVVLRNGERLLKLVNTLLDFSRLEAGVVEASFEPVDLAAYTAEIAQAFAIAVERVGLTLTLDCPPLPDPVWVDREMWAEVVLNLLSNALKFTFSGGIVVRLRDEGESVRLVVEDTGTGIPDDQQGRLFERFARVGGAVGRSHEGTGIGLALVADIAAAHGGTAAVDSEPGRGSAFSVTVRKGTEHLPQDRLVEVEEPEQEGGALRRARGFLAEALRWLGGEGRQQRREQAEQAPGDRPRVLVVDDNADMRDYVARLLAPDHEVLVAADGLEGLELARSATPDLVLTDVMMPRLDGFGLLARLREDPLTSSVPVVLLSARAGEEATVEGLEAGADDYLAKPFSGRELLARVRANLELERVRRARRDLQRRQELLEEAQALARVSSWEVDLATGAVRGSPEFLRQLQLDEQELADGLEGVLVARVHPEDRERVTALIEDAARTGQPLDYETRLLLPDGSSPVFRTLGVLERDEDGQPLRLRGSNQDVTEQRAAERAVASAAAQREAAAREHRIADELQRSLLPSEQAHAEALEVAAFYRAGAEGTRVGGDWYDVIELGAGRTALVLGDVMGRGVRAAAVMGQLRSAVRAYARLDLPPVDVLEHLDGVVRDLGEDQIVTCVYAVWDPHDRVLTWANAGHLPPLVREAGGRVRQLPPADGAPLGAAVGSLVEQSERLAPGSVLALYTDGLVEQRDRDLDAGISALAEAMVSLPEVLAPHVPAGLVAALLPQGPDDDVALLLAQVEDVDVRSVSLAVPQDASGLRGLRHDAARVLDAWGLDGRRDDALLLLSELATNALLYGHPPAEVRLRRGRDALVLEVRDSASFLPRRMRPSSDDEHGRGLELVAVLSRRWGVRPVGEGKAVWCVLEAPVQGTV